MNPIPVTDAGRPSSRDSRRALRSLAKLKGVQLAYVDIDQNRRTASPEALVAVLRAMGLSIGSPDDAPEALQAELRAARAHPVPPNVVAWNGRLPNIPWSGDLLSGQRLKVELRLEDGETLIALDAEAEEGRGTSVLRLRDAGTLPIGYHVLHIDGPNVEATVNIFSAPPRCWSDAERDGRRELGVFLPLYALQSERSMGVGDLGDLARLAEWAQGYGCRYVGTLPLLASFLSEEPFEPSPYSPASRLFWNELFLDLGEPDDPALREQAARLRESKLVNYRGTMTVKRRMLDRASDEAWSSDASRRTLEDAVADDPELDRYAIFRAAVERQRAAWTAWPERMRNGEFREGDYDDRARRVHVYAQHALGEQFAELSKRGEGASGGLYLDLPIGANGAGYDVWRFRDQFAPDASVGAPPDPFFAGGQDWGFPPLQPVGSRQRGHRYFREVIRRHLEHADMLRIDHVMALHRLYWIPRGIDAREGVYVRYPADELYAILSIESHRRRSRIVGENLGTVPAEVNRSMRRRGLLGMSITQFEMSSDVDQAVAEPPAHTLTALNTHDTPTFAAFWTGADLHRRVRMGLLDEEQAREERVGRARMKEAVIEFLRERGLVTGAAPQTDDVLLGLLRFGAGSAAEVQIVNLEDLWLETAPQNMPGIAEEYPNWRRKAARSLERICEDSSIAALLEDLADRRRGEVATSAHAHSVQTGQ